MRSRGSAKLLPGVRSKTVKMGGGPRTPPRTCQAILARQWQSESVLCVGVVPATRPDHKPVGLDPGHQAPPTHLLGREAAPPVGGVAAHAVHVAGPGRTERLVAGPAVLHPVPGPGGSTRRASCHTPTIVTISEVDKQPVRSSPTRLPGRRD